MRSIFTGATQIRGVPDPSAVTVSAPSGKWKSGTGGKRTAVPPVFAIFAQYYTFSFRDMLKRKLGKLGKDRKNTVP